MDARMLGMRMVPNSGEAVGWGTVPSGRRVIPWTETQYEFFYAGREPKAGPGLQREPVRDESSADTASSKILTFGGDPAAGCSANMCPPRPLRPRHGPVRRITGRTGCGRPPEQTATCQPNSGRDILARARCRAPAPRSHRCSRFPTICSEGGPHGRIPGSASPTSGLH